MIRKGTNIHRLLEKWLKLWQEEKFGLLIQGNVHCGHSLHSTHHRLQDFKDCIVKLFSKLILEDIDQSAVCPVTEHAGEGVSDIDVMVATGQNYSISVRDAFSVKDVLLLRHVELHVPPVSALP